MVCRIILLHEDPQFGQGFFNKLAGFDFTQYSLTVHNPKAIDCQSIVSSGRYDMCLLHEDFMDHFTTTTISSLVNQTPIILLSNKPHKNQASEHFSDTLLLDTLSAELLDKSLRYVQEQKRHKRELKALTLFDSLTQLPNRNNFQNELSLAIAKHSRRQSSFSLLLINLDRFKLFNESLGHAIGDEILIRTSKTLKMNLRQNDMAARMGNDEFAVLLETDQVETMAERLMNQLAQTLCLNEHDLRIHASIGVANFPQDGKNNNELIKAADTAVQSAKQRGGGLLYFYDASIQRQSFENSWIETEFYRALNKEELYIEYQPIVSAAENRCVKLEALCRWLHPEKGLVSPSEFIPVIEKTPMIIQLGLWVLQTVCHEIKLLEQKSLDIKITINISMMQLCHTNFTHDVKNILAETCVNANHLEFELTESALMMDPRQSINTLTSLRALGINIAIDDFGKGHSSLAYLVDLPIDVLKIDRSFISEFLSNRKRESVVKAIIALARSLNLTTVAEGVEDQRTADNLLALGCDLLQGFHISHPKEMNHVMTLDYMPKPVGF
jgi:diguanylate cyclase (GGDEF)-like protein